GQAEPGDGSPEIFHNIYPSAHIHAKMICPGYGIALEEIIRPDPYPLESVEERPQRLVRV
ncbi:MAG: hypothetical protein COX51_01590, partial [Syntrophobacteraceae bacterium CG23_combo_of_CG06-09_8_20_14_all_50_8]